MENWRNKIIFNSKQFYSQKDLKSNTFGLLFCDKISGFYIDLIPLNEPPKRHTYDTEYSFILLFERDFIEEDDVEYALDVLKLFKLTEDQQLCFKKNGEESKDIASILSLLNKELLKSTANYQIIKSLLKVLLLHLIRFQNAYLLPQDLKQNRIYQFLNLMEVHFKKETKPEFYAAQLGISVKRLNQIVKEKLHHTAIQIIKQRQITEIKRELQKQNKSIKEIAFDYQFSSVSSFSRFFKQNTNISPREFKLWH